MDQARFDAIRLARSPRIGAITYRHLIARFGSASEALRALPDLKKRGGGGQATQRELADEQRVAAEVEQAEALGARYLIWGDADYPALLAETDDAPSVMTCRGDLSLAQQHCVAMVGARNSSAAARVFARGLAQQLADEGVTVVSGLALGIDASAHEGAGARTIGVIATGIDISYPHRNAELQEHIAQAALLIAEQPLGTGPHAKLFPRRNRIIAGLSLATIVVEAAPQSGSLITARLAGEYGREVLAIPGSPLDPRAQGCNQLIREGATLIQSAADVMEAIAHIDPRSVRTPHAPYEPPVEDIVDIEDSERATLTELLGPVAVPVDELVRQSGMSAAAVQMALLELELAGRLERHAGARVSLV